MLEKEEIVSPNLEELKSHYHSIITLLGEDAGREGLLETPERVAKAMLSLTKGYHMEVSGRIQSDGDSERHRFLLSLRTPHVAVLRKSTRGIYP